MNRISRGIKAATEAALLSTQKYRVGAAIYLGNRLISFGWNSQKTAPANGSIFKWHHAETAALIGTSKVELAKAVIYVVRLTKGGSKRMARPCKNCSVVLKNAGIRRAFYTNQYGLIESLKF